MLAMLVVALALGVAVVVIGAPIYRAFGEANGEPHSAPDAPVAPAGSSEREAEREAKLREIRDAELDWRTGKLSEQDWRVLDTKLRSEAAALLREPPPSQTTEAAG